MDAPRIDDTQLDDLARRLGHNFRGLDPQDPATVRGIENTIKRIQDVHRRLDDQALTAPPPFPGKPWPRVRQITDADALRLRDAILAQLS